MSWWTPLVLLTVPALVMVVLQVLLYGLVAVVEGSDDPLATSLTPLKLLAVNVSIAVSGLLAVVLLTWTTGAPWRSLISWPRAFDVRRLVHHLLGAALMVAAGIGVVALVAPGSPGWTAFGISGTTVALLVVTVLTTPAQAAGEELMFRSVALPAAASWVRAVRPALVVGLVVSGLAFAAVHGSVDPWLAGYYTLIGVSTGLMAVLSGGIEAPVAFHVANNVLATVVNSVMADGGAVPLDRSVGAGDASLLVLVAVNVAMVVLVWAHERRRPGPARS
ncbi:CPBP family intramembrane metalloprotease [Pseudonocardia broussonetiae]|uniref:CPBP family intramembrane metalloprotease n=2 Tax=Pseudonocardia broussonetiae TaxID=2736640 RepID=A0A6M6JUM5_9PSEU|nr:CPBP family intramembrane metalloprotease [Pseudonocardia broussonetiae]